MGQQQVLQQRDQITYRLKAKMAAKGSRIGFAAKRSDNLQAEDEDGHQRVRNRFCSKETRSLTF
jgi:hypothetical protein